MSIITLQEVYSYEFLNVHIKIVIFNCECFLNPSSYSSFDLGGNTLINSDLIIDNPYLVNITNYPTTILENIPAENKKVNTIVWLPA